MACCNRRRALLVSRSPSPAARAGTTARPAATLHSAPPPRPSTARPDTVPPSTAQPDGAEVRLRFTGSRRVRVEGVASGRIYQASPTAPLVTASQEDVRSLVRSGLFVRV
jgi:hypothetical protein